MVAQRSGRTACTFFAVPAKNYVGKAREHRADNDVIIRCIMDHEPAINTFPDPKFDVDFISDVSKGRTIDAGGSRCEVAECA